MNNNLIITIGREYGTGGREIGQKLAPPSWAFRSMTGN